MIVNLILVIWINTCHCSIGKKPNYVDYSASTEEIECSQKTPKFMITKYKNIFSKG